ncbi:MAG: DUF86 domain-containing protein [Cyclobacteriaceae bacterium]
MNNRVNVWLLDVLNSIEEIEMDLPETKDFFLYKNNRTAKRAIERNLEIIGEAINRILSLDPDIKISQARKIVDFRNRIIHGYDSISDEIVWTTATRDLPVLKLEITDLLNKINSDR